MSTDTKGVVATPVKNVMLICELMERSINQLIRDEQSIAEPAGRLNFSKDFGTCSLSISPASRAVSFSFRFKRQPRTLMLFLDCDHDRKSIAPKTLNMSMGAFGESELFVRTALHALSILGPAYIDVNDCDAVGFTPLSEPSLTVLDLLHLKYWSPFRIEDWIQWFKEGLVGEGKTFEQFFGFKESWFKEHLARESRDVLYGLLCDLAAKRAPATPSYLLEYHERSAA